jgi:hypothetical protein
MMRANEDEEEEEELESPSPYLNFPKSDRVITLAHTMTFIENTPNGWKEEQQTIVRYLRRIQRDLRNEIKREQEEMCIQTSITSFFR